MMVGVGFTLCWIYIQIGWYYKWTFVMPLILYHEQPIFKNYGLSLIPWIGFFHLLDDFMHAIPIIFLISLKLDMGIS
jgi:hypothetical protein